MSLAAWLFASFSLGFASNDVADQLGGRGTDQPVLYFGDSSHINCQDHIVSTLRREWQSASGAKAYPPREIPEDLKAEFTRCGYIPTKKYYVDDSNQGRGSHYSFSRQYVEAAIKYVNTARRRRKRFLELKPNSFMSAGQIGLKQPSDLWLLESLEQFSVEGADVAVVGTMEPWVESWCIAFGAKSVTTIEYNNLTIDHPGITTVTAARFAELQSEAALDPITEDGSAKLQATNSSPRLLFDVVISITSVDHDGLGRYGDPIAPDGDLSTVRDFKVMLKPNGLKRVFLSVPIGQDLLVWNLHRRYGRKRLPLLLRGWRILDVFSLERATRSTERRQLELLERAHHSPSKQEDTGVNRVPYGSVLRWFQSKLASPSDHRKTYEPVFVLTPDEAELHNAEPYLHMNQWDHQVEAGKKAGTMQDEISDVENRPMEPDLTSREAVARHVTEQNSASHNQAHGEL